MASQKEIIFLILLQLLIVPAMITVALGFRGIDFGNSRADLSFPAAEKSNEAAFPGTVAKKARAQDNVEIKIDNVALVDLGNGSAGIRFEGQAKPAADISIYIFSIPVAAVTKTDGAGRWAYTLDRNLADGRYLAYAATVDSNGAILSRSPDFIFTKKGEIMNRVAASGEMPYPSSVKELKNDFAYSTLSAILLASAAALLVIGLTIRGKGKGKRA